MCYSLFMQKPPVVYTEVGPGVLQADPVAAQIAFTRMLRESPAATIDDVLNQLRLAGREDDAAHFAWQRDYTNSCNAVEMGLPSKALTESLALAIAIEDVEFDGPIGLAGKPGTGKGTLAGWLGRFFGHNPYISSGDELKKRQAEQSAVLAGGLANGDVVFDMLKGILDEAKNISGTTEPILDGYPRGLEQVLQMRQLLGEAAMEKYVLVVLEASDETAKHRILNIRKTQQDRIDDNEQTLIRRLATHERETEPAIRLMEQIGIAVVRVNAEQSIENVAADAINGIIGFAKQMKLGRKAIDWALAETLVAQAKATAETSTTTQPRVSVISSLVSCLKSWQSLWPKAKKIQQVAVPATAI